MYLPMYSILFYDAPFSIPCIRKIDKIILKLTKSICNLIQSTNQHLYPTTHREIWHQNSLLPRYVTTISEQFTQTLNNHGTLGRIYQDLVKFIITKYGGVEHLPVLDCQICSRSPTAHNLYLLKNQINIHLNTTFSFIHLFLHKNLYKSFFYPTLTPHPNIQLGKISLRNLLRSIS
jgi:hypothetical protein